MENETIKKRNLILILLLVFGTIVIFVGLVWVIAANPPNNPMELANPGNPVGEQRTQKNCTYPVAFWREHPELYPSSIVLGGTVYQPEDIKRVLENSDNGLVENLQAQLVSVYMNSLSGADQSLIEVTIFQAYQWMVQHPQGSQPTDSEIEEGSRLYSILEAYNLGLAGVTACPDGIIPANTVLASTSWTATMWISMTPSPTGSPTPSQTTTPTTPPTFPFWTAVPTQTRTPTTEVPNNPPATQQPPAPTNTIAPPTEAPPATETEAPPTSTLPPEPTLPPPP